VAYSQAVADRVRDQLEGVKRVTEREMFGGIAFMVGGNMCSGVIGDELLARVPPELHQDALTRPHTRPFEMGGRSSRGFVLVGRDGVEEDNDLALWIRLGVTHAQSLPPKKAAKRKAPAKKKAPVEKKAPVTKAKRNVSSKKSPVKKKAVAAKATEATKKKAPARKAAKKKPASKRR
jgi:hypothetical protein